MGDACGMMFAPISLGLGFIVREERFRNFQNSTRETVFLGLEHKQSRLGMQVTKCDTELNKVAFSSLPQKSQHKSEISKAGSY